MPFRIAQRIARSAAVQLRPRLVARPVLITPLSNPLAHGFPRYYGSATGKRPVDEKVEDLSDLYVSAKDEFEIAVEETEKNTIYARDDRETAREELNKFKQAYEEAIANSSPEDGQEIKTRVGQRLRELDNAVEWLSKADEEEH
ncbi:hypothetical protein H072_2128 [Dactylellina haptotyla CBS 200.50]|uniref:Uncharacterized protein n=1 Tax=Dactylellina haptotyla (strain CBS 200.50) TaxID=1284197 RepID=S8AM57_DACHA|nr:hypothetical protein H072_2128 [Dactylellina haptotyla CBS 200.50]